MNNERNIETLWDDNPIDVSTEVNFIWSIANKLRGPYQSDKYKDVIIPMVIIRRFECALEETKAAGRCLHIQQKQCIRYLDIGSIIQVSIHWLNS